MSGFQTKLQLQRLETTLVKLQKTVGQLDNNGNSELLEQIEQILSQQTSLDDKLNGLGTQISELERNIKMLELNPKQMELENKVNSVQQEISSFNQLKKELQTNKESVDKEIKVILGVQQQLLKKVNDCSKRIDSIKQSDSESE